MTISWTPIGKGDFASCPREVEGPLRVVSGVKDIVALMKDKDAETSIVVTTVAGGTAVSTIIKRTMAVVSTIGGPNSHIVVVARDFGVPCIVAAREIDISVLPAGARLRLDLDGTVSIDSASWPADDSSSPAELQEIARPKLSPEQFRVLRSIAFAGAVMDPSELLGVDRASVRSVVDQLVAASLVDRGDVLMTTPAGETALSDWFAADRAALGTAATKLHQQFQPLDAELKRLASAWQLAEAADNWERRLEIVEALASLHHQLRVLFSRHNEAIGRFDDYIRRLGKALAHVREGRTAYVASLSVDSYHTAWFQMHEDLLRVLDEQRDSE